MATVLRRMVTTLIRLREKLELQLCTVFHSTRNSIILTRNAYRLRILQEHDEKPLLSLFLHAKQKWRTPPSFAVLHMLYSEHIFGKPIEKTHTRCKTKRRKMWQLLWNGCEKLWQTNSSTMYQRVEERCALSTGKEGKHRKTKWKNARWRWGGGGRARRIKSYYVEISLRKWQRYCVNKRLFSFVCVKSWGYNFALFFIRLSMQSFRPATRPNSDWCRTEPEFSAMTPVLDKRNSCTRPRFAILHTLHSEYIFRKLIEKTNTRWRTKRWKFLRL